MDFVKKFMDISRMTSHAKGDILFRQNDPARCFYILLSGCVQLSIGKPGEVVYEACRVGEAFGWSSLIGGDDYSASAECIEPTQLLQIDHEKFNRILDRDPSNGIIFFRQLASNLGHRLLESYKIISSRS